MTDEVTILNFEMFAGRSQAIEQQIEDINGDPYPLAAGASIEWHMKRSAKATDLIVKTVGDGITVEDDTYTVTLEPEDTAGLEGLYYHEAVISDLDIVNTVLYGQVTIRPAVEIGGAG
jgi:hypothetical protein